MIPVILLAVLMSVSAEIAISITPMRVDLKFVPGATINDTLTVSNTGDQPVRIKVSIQDWELTFQGTPVFASPQPGTAFSCSRWIQINPVDFRLGAGQNRTIRYAIAVPETAAMQGYRSAVICEIIPDVKPGEKKKVQIKGQIAMIVYGTAGKPQPVCEVVDLKTESKAGKTDFVLIMKNKGPVQFRSGGQIEVRDAGNHKVAEVTIPDVPALPESEREIRIPFEKQLPMGEYRLIAMIDIGTKEMVGAEAKWIIR